MSIARPVPAAVAPEREALAGLVERVTFHSPETGFCVLRVKVRGQRELVTVVGAAAAISAGEFVQASGTWVNDRTHGLQFKAAFLRAAPPTTLEGIEKLSRLRHDQGHRPRLRQQAGRRRSARRVFDIDRAEPRAPAGGGRDRAQARRAHPASGWADQKVIREIMLFLHGHGVGTSRAVRIFKTYGADAVQVITENPYRLARDIRGIGFKSADQIAARLGIEKTAMIRARAGISYALAEALDDGHCGLPTDELRRARRRAARDPARGGRRRARAGARRGRGGGRHRRSACLRVPGRAAPGRARHRRAAAAAGRRPPALARDRRRQGAGLGRGAGPEIALAASQREAVRLALRSKLLVITGGPGVGKTTLVNSILKILAAKIPAIALAAPTGRAAKRLGEATGREAKTLHRLLEADPAQGGFKRGEEHPLDCDLLVVDEVSMVDVPLMHALLKAVPPAGGADPGRRRRPAALGRAGAGAGRRHRLGRGAGGPADRGVPPGGPEPDRHQRPPDQPGPDARAGRGPGQRLPPGPLPGPRGRRGQAAGGRGPAHPGPVRARPDPGRPGAVPDEPGRARCPVAEPRAAAALEPAGRGPGRALRLDLRPRRQGHAGGERLREGGVQRRPRAGAGGSTPRPASWSSTSTGARSPTTSASWTSWCWPTPPRCTRRRARSTRRW